MMIHSCLKAARYVIRIMPLPVNPARLTLLLHTVLWFVLGGVVSYVLGFLFSIHETMLTSCVLTAASLLSLTNGMIGGAFWLMNTEESI